MKLTIKEEVVVFNNEFGEYHLSLKEFNKLGEEKAIEYATQEIAKKSEGRASLYKTFDFNTCHEKLGFCEYGIKDFCKLTGLDIDGSYTRKEIIDACTVEAFKEYPVEILKITGRSLVDKWGGAVAIIDKYGLYKPFLNTMFFTEIELHELACQFARACLHHFENEYPDDKRPRKAIEAKEKVIRIMKEEGILTLDGY